MQLRFSLLFQFQYHQEQNYHEPRALIDSNGDGQIDLVGREFRDQLREQQQYLLAVEIAPPSSRKHIELAFR